MTEHEQHRDEVVTFGEQDSPATNMVTVPLGGRFQCPCGNVMTHSGLWLAAHWNDNLACQCKQCRQWFFAKGGRIRLKGKPYGSRKRFRNGGVT